MAIKIYGKLDSQALNDEGKPILGEAKQIELDPSNNIPSSNTTVQEAIEDLYKNGGGGSNVKLQNLSSGAQFMSMLDMAQWPRTLLASIGTSYTGNEGEMFVMYGGLGDDDLPAVIAYKENNVVYTLGEPSEYVIYTAKDNNRSYYWNGTKFIEVPAITILNVNDNKNYRIWVGTQQEYNDLYRPEDDVIYFIGTSHEEPGTTTYYNIDTSGLKHCAISPATTQVEAGASYIATLSPDFGYTIDEINITKRGIDITNDEGVCTEENGQIHININNVDGNIKIQATAIKPLSKITILNIGQESNQVNLKASLTPTDTDQSSVKWYFADSNGIETSMYTTISLQFRNDAATVTIGEGTDHLTAYVVCESLITPSIKDKIQLRLTYDENSGGDEPEPEPYDGDEVIDFKDPVVKSILLEAGYGNVTVPNGITVREARVTPSGLNPRTLFTLDERKDQITSFDEWEHFDNVRFSVKNCTNLTSVKVPYLKGVSNQNVFDKSFGLVGTKISTLQIPEGYTSYNMNMNTFNDGYVGMPSGESFTSITFPKTMESIDSPIGSGSTLPNITELDLSNTNIVNLCAQAFYSMTNLTTIKLPDTLKTIDNQTPFFRCKNLSWIEFGRNFEGVSDPSLLLFSDNATSVASITLVFHGRYAPNLLSSNISNSNSNSRINKIDKILVHEEFYDYYTSIESGFFYDFRGRIEKIESQQNQ